MMTLDTELSRAQNPCGVLGETDRDGAGSAAPPADSARLAREAPHRPETAQERATRRRAYLGDWPQVMAEHARQLRARKGK